MENLIEITNKHLMMVAFFFDIDRFDTYNNESQIFSLVFNDEIRAIYNKVIVSFGYPDGYAHEDIYSFITRDKYCTFDFSREENYISFKNIPFCWVMEDINYDVVKKLEELFHEKFPNAYKGVTTIDPSSNNINNQFWKMLDRVVSYSNNIITVPFQKGHLFLFNEETKKLAISFEYDTMHSQNCDLSPSFLSSFIKNKKDLEIIGGFHHINKNINILNFSLVKELNLAGILIWSGIEDIDKTKIFKEDTIFTKTTHEFVFSSLYYCSQGIERLQKIILELIAYIKKPNSNGLNTINRLLRSHNHVHMEQEITSYNITSRLLTTNARKLLESLYLFYRNSRYSRFNNNSDLMSELTLLRNFGNSIPDDENYDSNIKHLYGKHLAELCNYYYKIISNLSRQINVYIYELDYSTTSAKVFSINNLNANLYELLLMSKLAKKEVFWWLIKNPDYYKGLINSIDFDFINFDPADINDFIGEIITNRSGAQNIVDSVEHYYEQYSDSQKSERKEVITAILGDSHVPLFQDEIFDDDDD